MTASSKYTQTFLTKISSLNVWYDSGPSDSANSDLDFSFTLSSICKDQKNAFQNLAIFIKNGYIFVSWP
jgi:hypothetical protein